MANSNPHELKTIQNLEAAFAGESIEHAEQFKAVLEKAAKRFAALAKVEERHANHYRAALARVTG
jgi:rubrerythrin